MSQLARVRLEAGYYSTAGMVEVFDGFAWYCSVTSPPNMWLNIKVSEVNPLGGPPAEVKIAQPMTMANILTSVCEAFSEVEEQEIDWEDKTEESVVEGSDKLIRIDFGNKGVSLQEAIGIMNQAFGNIALCTLRSHRTGGTRIIECLDYEKDKVVAGNDVLVDKDHGLLSVTGIDVVNGCVTTFLDGTAPDELTHLRLKSELNPQANGRYYIVKKQYVGQFMGQEWYSRYFCSAKESDS